MVIKILIVYERMLENVLRVVDAPVKGIKRMLDKATAL